jgi:hypothetical protein
MHMHVGFHLKQALHVHKYGLRNRPKFKLCMEPAGKEQDQHDDDDALQWQKATCVESG